MNHLEGLVSNVPALLAQANNGPGQDVNWLVVWAVVLLTLAVALFFVEIFVPSGGLIGTAAAVSLVAGIVMLFQIDTTIGLIGATIALLALPFAIGFAIKLLPNTPIARALTLRAGRSAAAGVGEVDEEEAEATSEEGAGPVGSASSTAKGVPDVPDVGATGKAISGLRPVGTCLIDGKRHDCLAVGGPIGPGTRIEVIAVDGMHVRVRPIST